jgi:hypothetical protein
VGAFLVARLGGSAAAAALVCTLAAWIAGPLLAALVIFEAGDPLA